MPERGPVGGIKLDGPSRGGVAAAVDYDGDGVAEEALNVEFDLNCASGGNWGDVGVLCGADRLYCFRLSGKGGNPGALERDLGVQLPRGIPDDGRSMGRG